MYADTTDVQSAIARQLENGSVVLSCTFAEGSTAQGCQLSITITHRVSIDITLNRTEIPKVIELSSLGALSDKSFITAKDIENDGTFSSVHIPGRLVLLTMKGTKV